MSGWGAAAAGATSIAGSIIGNEQQKRATRRENATNEAISRIDYQRKLADWDRENEYNSPKAQMQRYKEAGLNPNLIYGQGTPGNATEVGAAPSKASGRDGNIGNPLADMVDSMKSGAQMSNMKLQEEVQKQQAINLAANTENVTARTTGQGVKNKLDTGLLQYNLDAASENLKQQINATHQSDLQTMTMQKTQPFVISEAEKKVELLTNQIHGQQLINGLRAVELQMAKDGVYKTDAFWKRYWQKHQNALPDQLKSFDKFLMELRLPEPLKWLQKPTGIPADAFNPFK